MRPIFNRISECDLLISGWKPITYKLQTRWRHEHVLGAHTFDEACKIMKRFNRPEEV